MSSGGTNPNIRYESTYDHLKYDNVTISELYDFVKIRGQKGIINQSIADLLVEGGIISKQGVKIGRAKIGGEYVVANTVYSPKFAGVMSFDDKNNEFIVIDKDGLAVDLFHDEVSFATVSTDHILIEKSLISDSLQSKTGTLKDSLKVGSNEEFKVDSHGKVISASIDNTDGGITNTGSLTGVNDIVGDGELTMKSLKIETIHFTVDSDGHVKTASLNNSNGGITNTGDISGAGNITTSGDMVIGGNFKVLGNTTIIQSETKVIKDHLILMNYANTTGIEPANTHSGMIIQNIISSTDGSNNLFFGSDKEGVFTTFFTDSEGFTKDVNRGEMATARFKNLELTANSTEYAITTTGNISVSDIKAEDIRVEDIYAKDINAVDLSVNDLIGNNVVANTVSISNLTSSLINNSNGIIKHTGSLTEVKDIDGTGDLTMGTITMTNFEVDSGGNVITNHISVKNLTSESIDNSDGGIINTGDISNVVNITGTGDIEMGTISIKSGGFDVDSNGNVVTASIDNSNGGIINVGKLIGVSDFDVSGNLSVGNLTVNGIENLHSHITDLKSLTFDKFKITSDGHVGIGTTSPDNPLHIKDNGALIKMEGANHSYLEFYPQEGKGRGGYLGFPNANANHIDFRNEFGDLKFIANTGRIVIDHYDGDAANTDRGLFFGGTYGDEIANSAGIVNRIYDTGTERSEMVLFKFNDPPVGNGPDRIRLMGSEIRFDTYNTAIDDYANTSYEKMKIDQLGNVGIGITNPTEKLDVNGNIKAKDYKYSGSGATTAGKLFHLEYYTETFSNELVTILNPPPGVSVADSVSYWIPTMVYYGTTPIDINESSNSINTFWRFYIQLEDVIIPGRWELLHGFPGSNRTAKYAVLWIPKNLMSITGSPIYNEGSTPG